MSSLGVILVGDKAACGGVVTEGDASTTIDGRAQSYLGARIACEYQCFIASTQCATWTMPNNRPAVFHGDVSSRGCPLVSKQNGLCGIAAGGGVGEHIPLGFMQDENGEWVEKTFYDDAFLIEDDQGNPMANLHYVIKLKNGKEFGGVTDENGMTEKIPPQAEAEIISIEASFNHE